MARQARKSQQAKAAPASDQPGKDESPPAQTSHVAAEHPQVGFSTLNAQVGGVTAVNTQIEATIALLNKQVTDNPSDLAKVGLELATAQSLSIAVQDAVDHMRRMQVLAEATLARAAQPGANKDDSAAASSTQAGVESALLTLQRVTEIARATTTPPN